MISNKYRFIFVHASRTGGSSLERVAQSEVTVDKRTLHLGNTDFPEKHKNFQYYHDKYPEQFGSYFKFTIVRNPFDRLVSAWFWRTQVLCDTKPCELKEFVLARQRSSSYAAIFSLGGYSLQDAIRNFDYVGRFEELPRAYEYLCQKLNLPAQPVPHTNRTHFERYWDYYDQETVELVQDLYREDIELFGYKFESPTIGLKKAKTLANIVHQICADFPDTK